MLRKELKKNASFIRNVRTMFTGAMIGRVIAILSVPVIARLFDPHDFGISSLFVAIAMILVPLSTLQYQYALVLPEKDADAVILARLSLVTLITFVFLVALGVVVIAFSEIALPWVSDLGVWLYWLPVLIAIQGIGSVFYSYNVRIKNFRAIARSDIAEPLMIAGGRIGSGVVFGSNPAGLIMGYMLGALARIAVLSKHLQISLIRALLNEGARGVGKVAREYRDFPVYYMPSTLLKALSEGLPVLALGYLYSPAIVGMYAVADRLLHVPIILVRKAVGQTYLQKASEIARAGRSIRGSFIKICLGLAVIATPGCVILYLFGQDAFVLIMGERWEQAGRIAEILSIWLWVLIVMGPSGAVFRIQRRQKLYLKLQTYGFMAKLVVFVFAVAYALDLEATLWIFVVVSVCMELIMLMTAFLITRRPQAVE